MKKKFVLVILFFLPLHTWTQITYLGTLSKNQYAPDFTSNPHGQYGSKYGANSINNPYGTGNPYKPDSPF